MLQQERMAIVDALVADISTTDKERLRRYLYGLSNEELRKTATAYQTVHTEAASQVVADPRVIAAEQLVREKWEELQWANIFHTAINGRVLKDNQATRVALRSLIDESKGDQIGVQWFKQVAGSPALVSCWQSAKVLDPKWREQQAEAQDQQDRETFNEFARANGFTEAEANFHLAKSVLGSG